MKISNALAILVLTLANFGYADESRVLQEEERRTLAASKPFEKKTLAKQPTPNLGATLVATRPEKSAIRAEPTESKLGVIRVGEIEIRGLAAALFKHRKQPKKLFQVFNPFKPLTEREKRSRGPLPRTFGNAITDEPGGFSIFSIDR
jgi:hypothetical protein